MNINVPTPLRILLVEDSSVDARLIRLHLEREGLCQECRHVENEVDFVHALSWPPDVILSDYSLPHFSGLRALRIVKESGADIPFIVISGAVQEEIIVDVMKQGADDYIMKDRLTRLGSAIGNALEQKRLRDEKKRADDALRASDERLNLFFTQSLDGFFFMMLDEPVRWDGSVPKEQLLDYVFTHQRITRANDAILAQYRAKRDQFMGRTPADFFAHDLAEGRRVFQELFDKGHLEFKTDERRFDGTQMWIEGDYVCMYDSQGQIVGHFGIQREITERMQAESALRTAEAKFRTLTEQIPPIIYMANLDQHIGVTYISPQINSLGFTPEEWLADPELWLRQIHPEDQARIKAEIEQSIDTRRPFRSEYRIIAGDGSIKWLLDEAMDVVDGDGKPLYRQGFMLDITERKTVEEKLASRERFLKLLTDMTRAILLSSDFDTTMQLIAADMKKIIDADDCYIVGWDEEKRLPIAVTTTAILDFPFHEAQANSEEIGIAASILRAGHLIAVDDVYDSPYINVNAIRPYPAKSIVGIPLMIGEHKLGVAILAFNSPHSFTQEELDRADQAGNQVALALWNFKQSAEIQQKLKENNALARIERALSESERIGTGEVLQLIVDSARELMPHAEQSVIHLLDSEEQTLFAHAVSGFREREKEYRGIRMRLGEGVAGQVMSEGVTINIGDITAHPRFVTSTSLPNFRSLLVAPVQSGSSHIGTISVQSAKPNVFSRNDAELLKSLAIQAAVALENTRLFETTQQRLKEVNILYQISRELALSLDSDQLIRDMIGLLQQIFDYYYVQIYLIDRETQNLVIKHGSGPIGSELVRTGHHLLAGEGIVGHVAETSEPFVTNNVEEVVFFKRNPLLPDTQYEIAVPIKIGQQVIGVLDIQQTPPRRFSENDLHLMTAIADHFAIVLQKANLYSTLQIALQQEQMVRSQLIQSERLALVGRLLASVSHELNNPLQAIQNALFLLREEKNLSTQARQDLDVILAEAERMAALIERLRSAYRPIRMKDFQPVGMNSLIEDVHALISTHMRHKMITFEFVPDPELPHVSGLADQLRQVVLNLFLNAIEIMKPGGCLTVQTQSLVDENEVLIMVKDTGPGIDSEILPHIFDAFITTKHTGTGLGLTITHDIIQQHHGRIAAENDLSGGAVFSVWLPVDQGGEQ